MDLVLASAWAAGDGVRDPFDHRPSRVACDLAGWLVEDGQLEVDTGRCNYLWLEQTTQVDIDVGVTLRAELRHFDLTATEPAVAHAALVLDGMVPWEVDIPVPHPAQVLKPEWTAERAVPAGAELGFHLHNHGQNSWRLVRVQVQR